jgi:hypothetical protein
MSETLSEPLRNRTFSLPARLMEKIAHRFEPAQAEPPAETVAKAPEESGGLMPAELLPEHTRIKAQFSNTALALVDAFMALTKSSSREETYQKMLRGFGKRHGVDIPVLPPPYRRALILPATEKQRYKWLHRVDLWGPEDRSSSWLDELARVSGSPTISQLIKRIPFECTEDDVL